MISVIKISIPDNAQRENVVIALAQSGYKVWMPGDLNVCFEIGEELPENRPVIGNYRHKGEEDG